MGNFSMLSSDPDLDASSNRPVITSPSLQYPPIVTELRIEQSQVTPIFTEATAQAMRLAKAPVAILMVTGKSGCQIGAISGLEKFGQLPTQTNLLSELAGLEYCYAQVMSSESRFSVSDCQADPQLAQLSLVRVHGVQAYLGLPIVTAAKDRLGTIAILDFKSRQFTNREVEILQVISRLVASEFERKLLSQSQLDRSIDHLEYHQIVGFDDPIAAGEYNQGVDLVNSIAGQSSDVVALQQQPVSGHPHTNYSQMQGEIQFKLLTHLAQELRTPLTSILGMASVLQQEIYGALSSKQKDYLGIIHQSGQHLVTIVDEISQLSEFDETGTDFYQQPSPPQLTLRSVDLEMICQLALQSLEPLAQKKNQQINLDLTGWNLQLESLTENSWSIDKNKIRQIVYYLCLNLIHASSLDCQISIRLVNLMNRLQIQFVTTDPQVMLEPTNPDPDLESIANQPQIIRNLRQRLGLSLSHTLATSHGGTIEIMANRQGYQFSLLDRPI
jgi:signal transduction histidine kinase